MSTTTKAPWNLKPGMHLCPLTQSWDGKPFALGRITEIAKRRAHFSGGYVWHVRTDLGESLQYFGKSRAGAAERVKIYVEKKAQ